MYPISGKELWSCPSNTRLTISRDSSRSLQQPKTCWRSETSGGRCLLLPSEVVLRQTGTATPSPTLAWGRSTAPSLWRSSSPQGGRPSSRVHGAPHKGSQPPSARSRGEVPSTPRDQRQPASCGKWAQAGQPGRKRCLGRAAAAEGGGGPRQLGGGGEPS